VTGRKIFASGCPGGQLLMTCAVYEDPEAGPTVLHFPVPLDAEGVSILDTGTPSGCAARARTISSSTRCLSGRGDRGRRARGKWHPLFHLISMVAFP